jgi:uncharacterized protein DUF4232
MPMNSYKNIWIVSVIVAVLIIAFVALSGRNEQNEQLPINADTGAEIYGSSTVTGADEANAAGNGSVGIAQNGQMSSRPSTPAPSATPAQSGTGASADTAVVACDASKLDGSAQWQSQATALAGTAKVTNRSDASCRLVGHPSVNLLSGASFLGVSQINQGASGSVVLKPKQSANVSFTWSNWCSATAIAPTKVRVTLAGGTYLELPLIDSGGRAQAWMPSCGSAAASSMLTVGLFRI